MGSGSACRSLDGGFVKWNMGEKEDNGVNEGGPGSILSDLLAEGIKGFFWGPHGIQIGIGLTIIVVSKLMGYW